MSATMEHAALIIIIALYAACLGAGALALWIKGRGL